MEPSCFLENREFHLCDGEIDLEPICAHCFSNYRDFKGENFQYSSEFEL